MFVYVLCDRTAITNVFRANDSLILPKLVTTDAIDNTVFNTTNTMDSTLALRASLSIATLSPNK